MAVAVVEPVERNLHPGTAALTEMLAELGEVTADALTGVDDDAGEADLVDQVALLERLRSAVAASQAAAMVRLARARVERETWERHEGPQPTGGRRRAETVGRGLAEEIGLACRLSPTVAARRLGAARAWWFDLPHTFTALAAGRLHERVANAVVAETRHLPAATRQDVDWRLHDAVDLPGMGVRQALAAVGKAAYEADPRAYVQRGRHERDDRHVSLRPAPDTMSVLSGYLPVEQGVACLAALRTHTDTLVATGDDRTRGQIMADTLVERLTGQAHAPDVAVEIQIILPAGAPGAPDADATDAETSASDATNAETSASDADETGAAAAPTGTATLTGVGALPLSLARQLIDSSAGAKRLRVLQTSPAGHLVGISARRRFSGALADLITARDQTCREPFCDAPIRHLDHIRRHRDGGETTLTNGRGLCARHNLARERPGWCAAVIHDGRGEQPHTVRTTTPTGHSYTSRAPDPP